MRFLVLVIVAAGTGALSMTALQTWIPSNAPMFEAVRALGGSTAGFRLADINPVKAYHDAIRKVTMPVLKTYNFKMEPGVQRAISSGFNARIGQDIRRAQDIAAYGRNPMAW